MSQITTHVLDLSLGKPAEAIAVSLERQEAGKWTFFGQKNTDADGRIKDLLPQDDFEPGVYRLSFKTGPYFEARKIPCFYPEVHILFEIKDAASRCHVPLLLSPFGYSTYRGS